MDASEPSSTYFDENLSIPSSSKSSTLPSAGQQNAGSHLPRKRRRIDFSSGDRFIASRSSSASVPGLYYKRDQLHSRYEGVLGSSKRHQIGVPPSGSVPGRVHRHANALHTQMRFQNVLSTIVMPESDIRAPRRQRVSTNSLRAPSNADPFFSYFSPDSDTLNGHLYSGGDTPKSAAYRPTRFSDATVTSLTEPMRVYRNINHSAFKILDAPGLEDNFYLHLVDWGKGDQLSVVLDRTVFLYKCKTAKVETMYALPERASNRLVVSSVKFIGNGSELATGNMRGDLMLHDVETRRIVRSSPGQLKRVGVMDSIGSLIATGSQDSSIIIRDIRLPRPVRRITGHTDEVCGLKFSPFDDVVLASGGNDNKLFIWDLRATSPSSSETSTRQIHRGRLSTTPLSSLTNPPANLPGGTIADVIVGGKMDAGASPLLHLTEHRAAVRGLAWSPHTRGLLASGGGRQDPIIRFWNTLRGFKVDQLKCHAQVMDLSWSTTTDELLSTHGFPNDRPADGAMPGVVTIWHYPTRTANVSFAAHTCRVSYLAVSPQGRSFATAAGDETLRFFNVFPDMEKLAANPKETQIDGLSKIR